MKGLVSTIDIRGQISGFSNAPRANLNSSHVLYFTLMILGQQERKPTGSRVEHSAKKCNGGRFYIGRNRAVRFDASKP